MNLQRICNKYGGFDCFEEAGSRFHHSLRLGGRRIIMRQIRKGLMAGIVLSCIFMMTGCSVKETLSVFSGKEEKAEDENETTKVPDGFVIDENVEQPTITSEMGEPITYYLNQQADPITVEASVSDGGTLSYQWYHNNVDSNGGGTEVSGQTSNSFVPPTDTPGTVYYYVVITNTIDKGIQMNTSGTKCITVSESEKPDPEKGSFVDTEAGRTFVFEDGTNAVSQWIPYQGQTYCFDENGLMRRGWYQEGENIYNFDENGALRHGWYQEGEATFMFDENGVQVHGWYQEGDNVYNFDANGQMQKNTWYQEDERIYYFGGDGIMLRNADVDGHHLGPDGICQY